MHILRTRVLDTVGGEGEKDVVSRVGVEALFLDSLGHFAVARLDGQVLEVKHLLHDSAIRQTVWKARTTKMLVSTNARPVPLGTE